MRIALVHEFLTQFGGAERVLLELLAIWPDATVHVLVHKPDGVNHAFDGYRLNTSFVDRLPMARSSHKWYLALMPLAVESFDLAGYDVVLSDSSSFAKGANAKGLHVCYCHTPTRFLWTEGDSYLAATGYPWLVRLLARPILAFIKSWDHMAAQKPDFIIANSRNVQDRIKKYYGRDSEVIPPPVDAEFFRPTAAKGDYFLAASRLEPYKRVDLVIEAFNQLGWPLKVAGTGTALGKLKSMAKPNVVFLGKVPDEQLRDLYSGAQAYIFPAEEDAGIMVLEAQACGTPVIVYGSGGSLETVVPGVTGKFFDHQDVPSLVQALNGFNHANYDPAAIRKHAEGYDKQIFRQKIKTFVEGKLAASRQEAKRIA